MANFSEVVDELKENNQKTAALVNLQQQEVAVETAAGGAASASAKETEKNREGERSQNKILASLQSISGGIKGMAGNFGEMLKDKGKQVGGDIFGMLKKFAFGAAVAGVLVFLKSKYWEDTKKFIVEDMIPALKNLWENVLSPILSVFKDVFVKQWENVKGLFDDLGTAIDQFASGDILGGITTLIGGLGEFFFKTVDNVLTGIFNLVAGLFGFEGTDSIGMSMFSFILDTWSTITGAFDDVVEWFGSAFTWAKEGLLGAWTSLTDFVSEKWNATKDFFTESYTWAKEGIAGTWTSLTDFVTDKFTKATEFFTEVFTDPKSALQNLWKGITGDGGLVDLLFSPIDSAITTVTGWFNITMPADWSLTQTVKDALNIVFDWIDLAFVDPKAALEQLWTGLVGEGGLVDFLFKPIDKAIAWIQGVFSFGNPEEPFKMSTLVKDAFKSAKEWVTGLFTWGAEAGTTEAGDFSISKLVKGAIENIWNWFKGLMSIDINSIIKSIPGAETLLSWFAADATEQALAAATESGFYDKDWVGNSEINRTMVGSVPPEQIQAILADNDISDRDKQFLLDELARRGVPTMAKGGPVQLGKSYIVGEQGREFFIPTSNGLIVPDVSSASARTNMVQSGSVSNIANSVSGGTTIINAPQSNTNISGGSGGGGRIIPMNVTDNDPTFRAIAANSF